MTTPEPLGDGSQEPRFDSSQPQSAPIYAATTATMPPGPPLSKAPQGLAVAALIVGIVAFLSGLIPVFGALVGIAAVVLGVLALSRNQSKGKALSGVILGGVAILVSLAMTVGSFALMNSASDVTLPTVAVQPATEQPVKTSEPTPVETVEPPQETKAPEPVAPPVPADFKSALHQAESYSNMMHMSKAGVYDQLTSEYGGQFSPEAGQYAIDNVKADWMANALASAKSYQETMSMSPAAIHDQLTSEYGSKFTVEEADYAILHLND